MADNTPIARVSSIQGQAFAKDKSGALRVLRVGDQIFEGEVVVSGDNSSINLTSPDGRTLVVNANDTLTIDAEVTGLFKPDASDSALLAANKDANKIIQAINDGGSLDELLEETAAGESGSGAGGGPSFVRLLRVAEAVDPLVFDFNTARNGVGLESIFSGRNTQESTMPPSISATDDNAQATGQVSVNEQGLLSLADTSETTTGSIVIKAPGGFSSITVGGLVLSGAQLAALAGTPQTINTGVGTLTLTGYNAATGALSFSYTLNGAQNQPGATESIDSIALSVSGPGGIATSSLNVQIIDGFPQAFNDSNAVSEDAAPNSVSGNVMTAGAGADSLSADLTQVSGVVAGTPVSASGNVGGNVNGTYGTLNLNANGSYSYTLDNARPVVQSLSAGQTVKEIFTYTITDADGDASTATLTVTITGTNDVPVITNTASALAGSIAEAGNLDDGTAVAGTAIASGTLSASDVDAGATQTWTLQGTPSTTYGTMVLNATTGVWTYTLNNGLAATQALKEGQTVTESYVARVTDEFGAYVNQTITVTITGTNDVPVITNTASALAGSIAEAGNLDDGTAVAGTAIASGTLSASDVDAGATQTWTLQGTPSTTYGTMVLNATTGVWTYTLNNGLAATQALKEGQTVTESYVARVTDEFGAYVNQTINVTITGTNDVPVITNTASALAGSIAEAGNLDDGTAVAGTAIASGTLSASDVDAGATQTWTLQGTPSTTYGTMVLNATTGVWTYTLNNGLAATQALKEGQTVTESYVARVTDEFGAYVNQTITVTITGTNDVPVITNTASALAGSIAEAGNLDDGTAVAGTAIASGTLSASDVDAGATQTWTLQGTPSTTYGTMVLNATTGVWTYTLNNGLAATQALKEGQTVTESYVARVTDEFGAYVNQTINVTITGTNDVPVITNTASALAGSIAEAGNLDDGTAVAGTAIASGTLSASDVDAGATQTWTLQGTPSTTYGTMVLNATTGVWTYTLNNGLAATQALKEGQTVTESYVARVTDEFGAYVNQTINVTITGTNDVPVITNTASALAGSIAEAGNLDDGTAVAGTAIASGTLSASDVDAGATQTWTLQGTPSTTYGTMVLNATTGVWTYTLNNGLAATQALKEGQTVTESYVARVTDEFGAYVNQTITVTITGTNDVPVITNTASALAGSIAEAGNLDDGTAVAGTAIASGTLSASDVDTGATQTWTLQGTPSTTYGTMVLNATTGVWTYTLNNGLAATQALKEGQTVTESYVARVTDEFGAYVNQTINVTITGTNDVPVITNTASALAGSIAEAGNLDDGTAVAGTAIASGTLSASDVDAGATQTWTLQGTPSTTYGTMVLNATTGVWTYTLNNGLAATQALKEGQTVTESYVARVTDEFGAYVNQTITVTITGTNDVPVITNSAAALQGTVIEAGNLDDGTAVAGTAIASGTLSASDVDAGAIKNWSLQGTPSTTYGTMVLNATTGVWTYTLNNGLAATQALKEGQVVTETYTARVTDEFGAYVDQTIKVTITGTNDSPVATADVANATEDAADQSGYNDGNVGTTIIAGNVLSNDSDVDAGDTRSVTGVAAGSPASASGGVATSVAGTYGRVVIGANGSYTYTLDDTKPAVQALAQGQKVTDTFTYTITDAQGAISSTTLTVTITGTNDTPVITNSAGALLGTVIEAGNLDPGTVVTGTPTATGTLTASDVDTGATKSWSLQGTPSTTYGTMVLNATTGVWTYTLDNSLAATQALKEGQVVTQTYTARVTDDFGAYVDQTITVTVKGTNDVPVITNTAAARTGTIIEAGNLDDGTAVSGTAIASGTLSATDVDAGATRSWSLQGTPSTTYGTMVLNATTGVWTYTLNNSLAATQALKEGQVVTQTYTARVTDEFGAYVNQTITVTITGTNDVPVITNSAAALQGTVVEAGNLDPGTVVAGTVSATGTLTATDADSGATKSWSLQGTPSTTYGTMVLNATTGKWTYTLNNSLAATQALKEGQVVTETYVARVTDDFGAYVDQTITMTVKGTNDVPVITNTAAARTGTIIEAGNLDDGTAVSGTAIASGLLSASDVDAGATQTWALQGTPSTTYGTMVLNATTGVWTYTLNNGLAATQALKEGQVVTQTYTARVTDEFGAYVDQTITVTVKGTNDVPVITNTAAALAGSIVEAGNLDDGTLVTGTQTASGTLSATDADTGATRSWSLQGTPSTTYGTMVLNATTGKWTYTLNNSLAATQALKEGQVVTETYVARVTDDFGAYVDQTITVTVKGTNDVPVITNTAAARTGTIIEAGNLDDGTTVAGTAIASGTLSASDVDAGATQTWALQGTPSTTYGTMVLNATTGVWTYTLNNGLAATQALKEGQVVTQTYTARVTDEFGAYVDQTITVTVKGTNDVPVITNTAAALAGSIVEAGNLDDGTLVTGTQTASGTLSATDADTGATRSWSLQGTQSTTYGTMVLNATTGVWTYTLNNSLAATQALKEGQVVTQTYTARVTDEFGAYVDQTITVTLAGTNDIPVITNSAAALTGSLIEAGNLDDGTVVAGTAIASGLLSASDVDAGATQTWALQGTPSTTYGTMVLNATTGVWTYTLNNGLAATQALKEGQTVTESYVARVTDEFGAYVDQTIKVTITGTNDSPVATADVVNVTEDAADQSGYNDGNVGTTIVAGNVLSNDSDVDAGDTRSVTGVAAGTVSLATGHVATSIAGTYGRVNIAADGSYTYTLDDTKPTVQALARGQTVTDTFTYTITDAQGAVSSTTLAVTVTGSNDTPDITVGTGDSIAASLTETDSALTSAGTLSIYDVDTRDIVTPSVASVTASGTYAGLAVLPSQVTNAQLLAMLAVSGGELSTLAQNAPNGINWKFNSGSQAFNFIPAGQVLVLTYTVKATDNSGGTNNYDTQTVSITITGTNDGVIINNDVKTIAENASGAALGGNVLSNDTIDPDYNEPTQVTSFSLDSNNDGIVETYLPGATVTVTTASGTLGVFTLNANGAYTFTPYQANYSGPVPVITYTAASPTNSGSATLTLTIAPVADAPVLSQDAATVVTPEDTVLTLGLNAPIRSSDVVDQNGASAGDNPERLGLISLSGIPAGVQLLDGLNGNAALFTSTGGTITILLSDIPAAQMISSPGTATLTLTTAQFEALRALPVAQSATNFTVTMSVTEYEVDTAGNPLAGVAGTANTVTVVADVQAVTDPVDLKIGGSDTTYDATLSEDSSFNLTPLLSASFQDVDGSEQRYIDLSGLPAGSVVNGVVVGASGSISIQLTNNNTLPAISLTPPANFSGDLTGITVTLRAKDTDADSTVSTQTQSDSVTLNLHVTPVAGDVALSTTAATDEDTAVKFLQSLVVTDTDGSEVLTGAVVNALPAGWVIRNDLGAVVFTGDGTTAYTVPAADIANGHFSNYTLTPAANSSVDATISLAVTSTDTRSVDGLTLTNVQTVNLSQTVTVTAVAEKVGSDSDADGMPDLTLNPSFAYVSPGQEDQWFALTRDGFDLKAGWSNQDSDEQTFALLTPVLSGGSAIGSQFSYTDGSGVTHTLTYTGTPLQIPMSALDSVQFKAVANLSGTFEIDVQVLTIDTDPDTGLSVQAISGHAALTTLVIDPVADPVTLAVDAPAVGLEDTAIALVIRPTSADPSETFTVTISGIPAGATITYGGVVQSISGGSVSIANFDAATALSITPPPNSNVDIPLVVSAVSVDTSGGVTSVSADTTLPLLVDVRGVADPVNLVVQSPLQTSEAVVDGNSRHIALSSVLTAVTPVDSDGSESVNVVISGVPAGIRLEGLTFLGGIGVGRLWSGTPAEIASAQLVLRDANYSGTISFTVRAVSTENDGSSLSGAIVPVSIQVAPSAEATLSTQTTAQEDTLTHVNFTLQAQHGDNNEALASVWINAADLSGKPFDLYLGSTLLSSALAVDGGWYKLTAAQAANVYVKSSANSDADGSFAIKYEVSDPSTDGTLAASVTQFDGVQNINVTAVTDATVAHNDYTGGMVSGTATLDVKVTVTQQADANAGGVADTDGSERLLYFIIDNVPIGVTVEGGRYIGNTSASGNTGRWILDTPDVPFTTASLEQTIRFSLDGTSTQLAGLTQPITIIAHTQDSGGSERTSATIWTLQTDPDFIDTSPLPGVPAAAITHWVPEPATVPMSEDAPSALSTLIHADITGTSPYAVTITGLPAGSVVSGMMQTVIGGQTIWSAQGNGDNASLQTLLAGITVTPPANWNANQGAFTFTTTLTTYDDGGGRNDASMTVTPPVTPVSDAAVITLGAADVLEDGTATITLALSNTADGASAQVIGGLVYVRIDESAMDTTGGTLTYGGSALVATTVTGVAGVPDGRYFILSGVGTTDSLSLSYQPPHNASGSVTYTAYVQEQESGATNVATSTQHGSFAVSPANDGVTISAPAASGFEDQRIALNIGVSLGDSSEIISSITLSNVPDGFLLYAGSGSPGSMAINLGGGVWGIQLINGQVPDYLALQPPANWSGTVSGLQLGVWSGEADLDPILTTSTLNVTVDGVADGISFTPTLSFGNEGQIVALNLNSTMPDHDGSELATLSIKNLGEHAAFYAGSSLLAATYDQASDTYTLSGLTSTQVSALGVIQKDGTYNLEVTGQTIDSPGSNASTVVSTTLNLSIANVAATSGDDNLLYDGTALNGLGGVDTIELRLGENIDFTTASKPSNIERIDLMPSGQNHSLDHLMLQDVLDMTGSSKTLTILGDSGDSVSLKDGNGNDQWVKSGATSSGGHDFDIYINANDAAVKVLIEQMITRHIDP